MIEMNSFMGWTSYRGSPKLLANWAVNFWPQAIKWGSKENDSSNV